MFGRGVEHDSADPAVAGIDDVIETLGEEFAGFGNTALDHLDRFGVEVSRNEIGQDRGDGRGELAGLQHDCIARRERADHRGEKQLHRIVPRGDDEYDPQGFGNECGRGRAHGQWKPDAPGAGPPPQMFAGVGDPGAHHAGLGESGLGGILTKVLPEGSFDDRAALAE